MINDYGKLYTQQCWLTAHNAWNTYLKPWNNQCKTITELLNYGVRGFALDIMGDDETSLHLQHLPDNPATRINWDIVRDEFKKWMTANPREIVTLFFESYLTGPQAGETAISALAWLDFTLRSIPGYKPGAHTQINSIKSETLAVLADGNGANNGTINATPHRFFAFIEEQPKTGPQDLFPTMRDYCAENMYGDPSLQKSTWVDLRPGSRYDAPVSFMNHFGDAPTGDEWERNKPVLLKEHADDFYRKYGNRYPNFISLDKINWDGQHAGPMPLFTMLKKPPRP